MSTIGPPRLSVDDWVAAGFAILAEEGIKALTISRLCSRLGVTKGSFYWHFADLATYRGALTETFAAVQDQDRSFFDDASGPPRQRLSAMMAALIAPRHWMLERAMREWARSDASVAAAVRASDRRVLAAVRQVFVDDGFSPDDADLRAEATFAAGIGFLHLAGRSPGSQQAERHESFLDLMLRH
ncbi:TetR/AcrR family transcriptional regulator [Mycobacterium sp. M1]|uniref:TetR/AcrR family transcriptional regulator n=1 Tax=Mycolicibacter acidiphilus TaxID=2835306 RepID=A0ABS5RD19_9MYCO|nr:TetR/AcrR family transcriptional regulator [Mycolicibacter acidiphilus]MBS9532170.1 TetR/AcrR family transcriptional regulator [Mycolicibacter acidiphilus]